MNEVGCFFGGCIVGFCCMYGLHLLTMGSLREMLVSLNCKFDSLIELLPKKQKKV